MKQIMFANNIYTNNYASASGGIIRIRGTMLVNLNSELLINNGDTFDEKLSEYNFHVIKSDPSNSSTYNNLL